MRRKADPGVAPSARQPTNNPPSRETAGRLSVLFTIVVAVALSACSGSGNSPIQPAAAAILPATTGAAPATRTLGDAGNEALATLEGRFYHAPGRWNACIPGNCGTVVRDWGADALSYALFLRWRVARDPSIRPIMDALAQSAPEYDACKRTTCTMWSDIPMWDAIAAAHAFEVTTRKPALEKAQRAFAVVDRSDAFARGACPSIDYQKPLGGNTALKTLETDSNYIRAALLLGHSTGDPAYLQKAKMKYAAVRRYFLDPVVPLYSVYVFDDGMTCTQLPKRFFASVNGNMIDNGLQLARRTGDGTYLRDALATAHAVTRYLSDAAGVYADLQADNDVAGPLVEAMYDIATQEHQGFARRWIIDAAAAAEPAETGAYGRFFDGPAPAGPISAWSSSGGLALAIAAGALDPARRAGSPRFWADEHYIPDPIVATPATIAFTGRAIALIGTLGENCCEAGHVRVFIDGSETFDNTGIWQNKSPASHRLPESVLLSWRWPRSGRHTIELQPGVANAKEGGSFIHLAGYELVR